MMGKDRREGWDGDLQDMQTITHIFWLPKMFIIRKVVQDARDD